MRMVSFSRVMVVLALLCFFLEALGLHPGVPVNFLALGLFFLAASFLV